MIRHDLPRFGAAILSIMLFSNILNLNISQNDARSLELAVNSKMLVAEAHDNVLEPGGEK